jgi:hypothetical protein
MSDYDIFAPPPWQARAAAVAIVSASLRGNTAENQTALDDAYETPWFGALIHAVLKLYRALALRLRTPTAVDLIDTQLTEITQEAWGLLASMADRRGPHPPRCRRFGAVRSGGFCGLCAD